MLSPPPPALARQEGSIGAIIAFAVRHTSDSLNLTALGIIIMLAGVAGI